LSARVENSGEFGMGVWLQFGRSLGGERWDGKEEEGETEDESVGRWVHIMAFSDGITDGIITSVMLSVMPSVTAPRHCTAITVWIPRYFPSVKSPDVTMPLRISRRNVYSVGETDGIYRRTYSVGIYRQSLRRNYVRRYKLPTEYFRR